ncbi:hypothetical protein C4D60_Mb03t13090 [Musa balbisiana]|uniref:Uncharacterized protein n=1 Tax=Musa balbisiana TaxID=52838 RepID=A0A4S8J9M3_MUSBA|nr:hypothetical protein C4D60_Mb03t13090 [Musa balbisiana]
MVDLRSVKKKPSAKAAAPPPQDGEGFGAGGAPQDGTPKRTLGSPEAGRPPEKMKALVQRTTADLIARMSVVPGSSGAAP